MKKIAYIGAALVVPMLAFAQAEDIGTLADIIIGIINGILVPLIFAVAFIVFIWGVFLYFIAGGHNEEQQGKGKSLMLWGLIGFFLMVSVWGLVNILVGTFDFDQAEIPQPPSLQYTDDSVI